MQRLLRTWGVPLISFSLLAFGLLHMLRAEKKSLPVPPPAAPSRSPWNETLAGNGIVEPQSENLSVGASLPGVVTEVFIQPDQAGTHVRKGDPLFRVDDRHLKAQLASREAMLAKPRAELQRLKAMPRPEEVLPARFRVEAMAARVAQTLDAYERQKRLAGTGAVTESERVDAREAHEAAEAELALARSELALIEAGAWAPDLTIVEAQIAQIEAEIAQIRTEIERSLVCAPIDGIVLQVNLRPGEFVATPSERTLIVLGDMRTPRVRVDIDEADIPRFSPSAAAEAVVRGDSNLRIPLRFVRTEPFVVPKKSLSGASDERVDTRVLQVLYEISGESPPVYVGQQLDIFIECPAAAASGSTESD